MKFSALLCASLFSLAACASSHDDTPSGPVIDELDVPDTTTTLTVNGQSGPGVVITLTAHDADAGMSALHVVFAETGQDLSVTLPGSPTTVTKQPIELVVVGAPKGAHALSLYVADVKGRNSASVSKTITVP